MLEYQKANLNLLMYLFLEQPKQNKKIIGLDNKLKIVFEHSKRYF